MKRVILTIALLAMGIAVTAQTVTIKKGVATMSESDYNLLKQKADAYETAKKTLDETLAAYQTLQQKYEMNKPTELKDFNDSASYAIGKDIYQSWLQQKLGINAAAAGQSMIDAYHGQNNWNEEIMRPLLSRFQREYEERQRAEQKKMMDGLEDNIAAGKKFLTENALNKSVYTTKSGLQYRIMKEGKGRKPTLKDRVKVHYTGTLIDGTKFDSSVDRGEPIELSLQQVIPGWTEGLQLMNEGSVYTFYVPYNLGYGDQPAGIIPPGSTLIFEIELIEILPKK